MLGKAAGGLWVRNMSSRGGEEEEKLKASYVEGGYIC